jgi:hypothetical protein
MVGDIILNTEATEPAISEVEPDLAAQSPNSWNYLHVGTDPFLHPVDWFLGPSSGQLTRSHPCRVSHGRFSHCRLPERAPPIASPHHDQKNRLGFCVDANLGGAAAISNHFARADLSTTTSESAAIDAIKIAFLIVPPSRHPSLDVNPGSGAS